MLGSLLRRFCDPKDIVVASTVALLLLILEAVLCGLIVVKVPYTEIDWVAYMEEVGGFLGGELDYKRLGGGTGPLVYPAGFVWLYSALYWLTGGGDIPTAQFIFILVYLSTQAVVMAIYIRARLVPPWALGLLCLSKRIHSIFVLRLFNDCFAALLAYGGVAALQGRRVHIAVVLFSAGVSVKMNVLLMAPPVLALALKVSTPTELLQAVLLGGGLQVVLALPFLASYPWSYLARAFELSRVFQHKWTVNLKFIPEEVFVSPRLAAFLLGMHLLLLVAWIGRQWFKDSGGPGTALRAFLSRSPSQPVEKPTPLRRSGPASPAPLGKQEGVGPDISWPLHVATVAFTGNLIGIATARTLHYQFYAWYFHTLPLLLWCTSLPTAARLLVLASVEWSFNIFPATHASSALLTICHVALLSLLWIAPSPAVMRKSHLA